MGALTRLSKSLMIWIWIFRLFLCVNNVSLKKKIDSLDIKKKIYSYGFADNVDVMMDASDCILTKPGGLTVSECLAKCIPMVLINPIPGQEDRNTEFC